MSSVSTISHSISEWSSENDLFERQFFVIAKIFNFFLGYSYSEQRVVRDGTLITSRGPGTAFEFGIELVRAVRGNDGHAENLAGPMLLKE